MDLVALFLSVIALWVSIYYSRRSDEVSREANRKADDANDLSKDANQLAHSANVYASEANMLAKQGVDIHQKTFENQYLPKVTFRYGSGGDLTTDPPTEYINLGVANEGHIPILIDWLGYWIVGSQVTAPVFTRDIIEGRPPFVLPAEILPGRVLHLPIASDSFRANLQLNAKSPDDEFTFRVVQQTGQWFETERLKVSDYLGEELPIRVTFHQEDPPDEGG